MHDVTLVAHRCGLRDGYDTSGSSHVGDKDRSLCLTLRKNFETMRTVCRIVGTSHCLLRVVSKDLDWYVSNRMQRQTGASSALGSGAAVVQLCRHDVGEILVSVRIDRR